MAALTKNQQRFRDAFAAETGLDRRFVGSWMLAEQSGSAAKNYDARGYNNWLNIGNTDSLVAGGGSFKSNVWADPQSAAKASADWMRGKGPVAKSYGRPAAGITKILSTAGKGAEAQIRALSTSGWASSGYNGGSVLRQLMGLEQGGAKSTAGAAQKGSGSSTTVAEPKTRTVTETATEFDEGGYERVRRQAALRGVLEQSGKMRMLAGLLPKEADPAEFTRDVETTRTETVPGQMKRPAPRAGGTGGGAAGIPGLKGKGSGIKELFYDPQGGWKGQQSIGAIGNHSDHVHVAAGKKTVIGLGKLAEEYGLTVRENPHWDKVDPVHVAGSNHYSNQAIDVSGDAKKMSAYTKRIRRIYGLS